MRGSALRAASSQRLAMATASLACRFQGWCRSRSGISRARRSGSASPAQGSSAV